VAAYQEVNMLKTFVFKQGEELLQSITVDDLVGTVDLKELFAAGIVHCETVDGVSVTEGRVVDCEKMRPEIIGYEPVVILVPETSGACRWRAVRRD